MSRFVVPEPVQRRAMSEGETGRAWLAGLDDLLTSIEAEWSLTIGEPIEGGSAAYVAEATDAEGNSFIIKATTPTQSEGRHEAEILALADGHGYVRLLRHDAARHVLLLEKLGDRLDRLELPYELQIDIMCATLIEAWRPVPVGSTYLTGDKKAESLAAGILSLWQQGGQPCPSSVIDTALRYCRERAALYRPQSAVLAHGDPHPANILAIPDTDPVRFRFIDPDGLAIEPAYDLGVLLRAWNDGLDGNSAYAQAWSRVRRLSERTAVVAEAIWQWGYIERVSTGLLLLQIGDPELGKQFLRVSEALLVPQD